MLVGLLPAAGAALRLRPYRSPKELFSLLLASATGGPPIPVPVCHFSLEAMRTAGVDRCVVAISEEKTEVLRVLSDGSDVGVPLAYFVQKDPQGLTNVVRRARPWIEGADVLLALPDTVLFPRDALRIIYEKKRATGADIVLGVFPTDEPEKLAPVELAEDGEVLSIHDKPSHRRWLNTWGVIAWSPAFTDFCAKWDEARAPETQGILSHAMEAARLAGLRVYGHFFETGVFRDVGTPDGLAAAVRLLASRGVVFTGSE